MLLKPQPSGVATPVRSSELPPGPFTATCFRLLGLSLVLLPLAFCGCLSGSGMPCGSSGVPPGGSFLGLRLDPEADRKRGARMARMTDDPRLRPSAVEQRQARAMAQAQAELIRQDGGIRYRGDGSSSSPESVRFVAMRGALTIDYRAAAGLNRQDGAPHALTLVVYHLANQNGFDHLSSHSEGMARLLEGERFDDSVLRVEEHTVQPGTSGSLTLHRPENGRYVALVAGYARGDARTAVYTTEYGLGRYKKEGKSYLDRMVYMFTPLPLHLAVDLDEEEMWVRDTGQIYGDMRKVTDLMWRQTQYYLSDPFN